MAYWWMFQKPGYYYQRARKEGRLWAPKMGRKRQSVPSWDTLTEVRPGDTIFLSVRRKFDAVLVARSTAYEARIEGVGTPERSWVADGWAVDAAFCELPRPVPVDEFIRELMSFATGRLFPFNKDGMGNNGYLYPLPAAAGRFLCDLVQSEVTVPADLVTEAVAIASETEREAVIDARVGQGRFRQEVMTLWRGRCCVTGLNIPELLRASHIKPWRDGNNQERLDPYNGLLLAPGVDAAFDRRLISFGEDGRLLAGGSLSIRQLSALGINRAVHVKGLNERHHGYLHYHRQEFFAAA